jgi:hypothetical protein
VDCDNINSEQLQDIIEYSFSQCTLKQLSLETSLKEADYVTKSHFILCECSECENGKSMSLYKMAGRTM